MRHDDRERAGACVDGRTERVEVGGDHAVGHGEARARREAALRIDDGDAPSEALGQLNDGKRVVTAAEDEEVRRRRDAFDQRVELRRLAHEGRTPGEHGPSGIAETLAHGARERRRGKRRRDRPIRREREAATGGNAFERRTEHGDERAARLAPDAVDPAFDEGERIVRVGHALDQDRRDAVAPEPEAPAHVIVRRRIVRDQRGLPRRRPPPCLSHHVPFEASPADAAGDPPIAGHEHPRSGRAIRRPAHVNQGREGERLSLTPESAGREDDRTELAHRRGPRGACPE
jgi:hypothetical protein